MKKQRKTLTERLGGRLGMLSITCMVVGTLSLATGTYLETSQVKKSEIQQTTMFHTKKIRRCEPFYQCVNGKLTESVESSEYGIESVESSEEHGTKCTYVLSDRGQVNCEPNCYVWEDGIHPVVGRREGSKTICETIEKPLGLYYLNKDDHTIIMTIPIKLK